MVQLHRFFPVCAFAVWTTYCQAAGPDKVLLEDQFDTFDTHTWKVDRPESFSTADGVLNIGRVHEQGSADVYSAPVARLTSYDSFRYATLEARVKFAASLSGEHIYYLGFFNREDWGYCFCWVQSSGDRLVLKARKAGGKNVDVASKGGFVPGKWYVFKIAWSKQGVEFFVNGQSVGRSDDRGVIPDSDMPVVFDIYASDGSRIGMQVDYVKVTGREMVFSTRPSTEVTLPTNRDLYPPRIKLPKVKPDIKITEDKKARLENSHYQVILDLNKGVSVQRLFNKYVAVDCLGSPGQDLFVVNAAGRTVGSSDLKLMDSKVLADASRGRHSLQLQLGCEVPRFEAIAALSIDDSPNIEIDLRLRNSSSEKLLCHIVFPYLQNVQIGKVADDYYFYPHQGGWCGKASYDLREEYGLLCWMQVMSVFNPKLGGGVGTWVKDPTGALKVMHVRKIEKANHKPIAFNSVHLKLNDPRYLPETLEPGIRLAIVHNEKQVLAGRSVTLPTAVLAVHQGDWRYPLFAYKAWADTWYRHVGTPEWVKKNFNVVYVHDRLGNTGFEKGFYSKKDKRYIMADSIEPGREDQHLELALWWQYYEDPNVPWGWLKKPNMGDYYYPQDRGGLEPFAEEIRKCQEKGSRISLYMEVTQCWKGTDIGKAHGKEWARMDSPGEYNRDYCIKPDDGYIVCPYVDGWQDYVANRFAQILKETGADGVRLDRGALMYPCFNAAHDHYKGTAESAVPAKRWADFLNKVRTAIQKVNPEAALFTEHAASDYLTQFHHGSTAQQFEWRFHEYEDKKVFNTYDLVFFRFLFPQFKLYNWGQTFEDGAKTAFFNAVACDRSELKQGQVYYYARTGKLLRESADVFATLHPVPLVRTEVDYLYANEFPLNDKTIYTMYNKNSQAVEGKLIEVDHRRGAHYVDLFYDRQIPYQAADGKASLHFDIPAGEVVAVAQFPQLLKVRRLDDRLLIDLEKTVPSPEVRVLFGEDEGEGRAVRIEDGSAVVEISDQEARGKIIIKLFSGGYLQDEAVLASWRK